MGGKGTALRAAVIGCGGISRFHFSGLEKAGVKVAWVCDINEAAAQPWAARYGARLTGDYREALADRAVNVVNVTTSSASHKAICLDAIAAGKAVICEKTLATTPGDARQIVAAAENAGTIFYTSYMKRFIPAVEQAKALMPSLGRIISTSIRAFQQWGDLWGDNPAEGFFHTPAGGASQLRRSYGGGILVCGGSHILDLVGHFLGRPHRLYASMHTPERRDYDLQAAAMLETANGVVHYEALAHPLANIGFLQDGWDERIEINGLNGRLEILSAMWDRPLEKASVLIHIDNTSGKTTTYRSAPVSPFDRAMAFFCANIARGEQGAQPRHTGYDVDELIAHMELSARKREAVDIKWQIG